LDKKNRSDDGSLVICHVISVGITEGICLVFAPNTVTLTVIKEWVENIDNIEIKNYIIH
jgi:hypothetical protein